MVLAITIVCVSITAFCMPVLGAEDVQVLKIATGSPYELGIVDALGEPFEERYDCTIEVTKAGSGASLNLGREGKVDLVIVHAPEAEETFVSDGYGLNRTYIMYNDFVIVGPKNDPALINGTTDAANAYKKIAETESLFFSRGDNSGTHKKEISIWNRAGITPDGDWYRVTHDFMGATLETANREEGYFMTDRSTYITLKKDLNLSILVEGDPILVNHYHAIAVNPDKHPGVNYELAVRFIDYISSEEGQAIIRNFGVEEFGEPLYFAAPASTVFTPISTPGESTTSAQTPCFGAVFAVTTLFAATYILRRR